MLMMMGMIVLAASLVVAVVDATLVYGYWNHSIATQLNPAAEGSAVQVCGHRRGLDWYRSGSGDHRPGASLASQPALGLIGLGHGPVLEWGWADLWEPVRPHTFLLSKICDGPSEVMAALTANPQILRLVKLVGSSSLKTAAWLMERMVDGMAPRSTGADDRDTSSALRDPADNPLFMLRPSFCDECTSETP